MIYDNAFTAVETPADCMLFFGVINLTEIAKIIAASTKRNRKFLNTKANKIHPPIIAISGIVSPQSIYFVLSLGGIKYVFIFLILLI
ncbi:MAG: hypothetical protein ACTTK5_04535 [Candidatus Fimenecus sp.]